MKIIHIQRDNTNGKVKYRKILYALEKITGAIIICKKIITRKILKVKNVNHAIIKLGAKSY